MPTFNRIDFGEKFINGVMAGREQADISRRNKALDALQRIYSGDQSAIADLMAVDPEAGRAVETQLGAQKFIKPAGPEVELAGPVRPGVDEPLTTRTPASVDSEGLTAYLASRGDSGALKALMEKAGPQASKWLGSTVTDKDGKVWGVNEQGWQQLPFEAKPQETQPKAPTTRTYNVGGKSVTQEWDATSGRWVDLAEAPRELPKQEKPEDPRDNLDYEIKLGNNYQRESESFKTVRQAKDNVDSALAQNSAAGDLAAATSIMKLLDPGSVVRESELGMAMNATGLFGRIGNYAEKIQSGQVLNPEQRKEMAALAKQLFETADKYQGQTKQRYVDMANQYQLNPRNILGADYMPEGGQQGGGIPPIPHANASAAYQEYWAAYHSAKTPEQRKAITARARQMGVVK